MKATTPDLLALLTSSLSKIEPSDTISVAGRKLILAETIRLIALQDGARLGEDPEFVHDMRVATRRTRSLLRLLAPYYRRKQVKRLQKPLRRLADRLGAVRDLDVLLEDLQKRDTTGLDELLEGLKVQQAKAARKFRTALDNGDFSDLIENLSAFALDTDDPLADSVPLPVEVRHVVPVLLHQQLAAVRGFNPLFEDGGNHDYETLHALRIAFKRLRYATSAFTDVLGPTATTFITELKSVQDHLGRLNDVVVFEARLAKYAGKGKKALDIPALDATRETLRGEATSLAESFSQAWTKFNSRTVQKYLSDALLALR
jgi:CHAD domain-containing protein